MNQIARYIIIFFGVLFLALTPFFYLRAPLATNVWAWQDGALSFIFISSILASVAVAVLYVGLSGELRTAIPGAINLGIITLASAIHFFSLSQADPQNNRLLNNAIGSAAVFLAMVVIFFWARRLPLNNRKPIPRLIKYSFVIFIIALLIAGSQMVILGNNVMPWPLDPRSMVVFGWIFLGASAYFSYSLIEPYWPMAWGQLLGFLAYDLVLIVPFVQHFERVKPEMLLNLTIYTGVLLYSGLLSLFFIVSKLLVRPRQEIRENG